MNELRCRPSGCEGIVSRMLNIPEGVLFVDLHDLIDKSGKSGSFALADEQLERIPVFIDVIKDMVN